MKTLATAILAISAIGWAGTSAVSAQSFGYSQFGYSQFGNTHGYGYGNSYGHAHGNLYGRGPAYIGVPHGDHVDIYRAPQQRYRPTYPAPITVTPGYSSFYFGGTVGRPTYPSTIHGGHRPAYPDHHWHPGHFLFHH
jgi:hypothetical protein